MKKKIILGESGGPTPVIDWEVAGAVDGAQKRGWQVYGMLNGLEGLLNANIEGNVVDLTDIDPMSFVYNGPGASLRTTRIKPKEEHYQKMAQNIKALGINSVVYFGGNDSAAQLLGLTESADVAAIHGIKTIDNDLPVTHHSPGYGSATLFNATAIKNLDSDFSSYRVKANFQAGNKIVQAWDIAPVAIYQVMGRKAGWLAQGTGFAKVDPKGDLDPNRAPHIIMSKEVTFDKGEFLESVDDVLTRLGSAVIVVQEDLTDRATNKSMAKAHGEKVKTDQHENIEHGRATSFSPGIFLAQLIGSELKVDAVYGSVKDAAIVPQHIQRSCMMSPVDASEAYKVGAACIDALENGQSRKSVILERNKGRTYVDLTDLENIAAKDKSVPSHYIDHLHGPTQDFVDEYIYLIGGPAAIPHYSRSLFPYVQVPDVISENPYIAGKK